MDRFDAMQAFVQVVETGSFTRAAASLHLSKTTVSQLVQQLEARLRVKLLHRTTRKVNVTAEGAAYYARAVQVLADVEDAETSLGAAALAPRGRLRVDVPSPLARLILIPALPDFQARYPDVELALGVSDRHVDLIDDGVDCVIRGGTLTDESLVARHVGDLSMGVYAAPRYLDVAGRPRHPHDVTQPPHRVVGFLRATSGRPLVFPLHRGKQSVPLQGPFALWVDDGNAYVAAAIAGLGVCTMPTYMAQPGMATGELEPLFAGWRLDPMPLHLAWRPNRHMSAKLRVFMDWVTEVMARHAPPRRLPAR